MRYFVPLIASDMQTFREENGARYFEEMTSASIFSPPKVCFTFENVLCHAVKTNLVKTNCFHGLENNRKKYLTGSFYLKID